MTDWLINKFTRSGNETDIRSSRGKAASITGILCNVLLFCVKLIIGLISGSVSVSADAVNNLSDASSGIISLLGFKMASKPADKEHPYGHARYEYLAGLSVAVLIIVIGVEILKNSIEKVISPTSVDVSTLSFAVLTGSILLKLWMAHFYTRVGKLINSGTLTAAAADSRNDCISTGAVLIAAVISRFTPLELDGWMGIAVAVFILISGAGLVKDTLDPLLGKAPDPELVAHIHNKIMSYPGVLGTHDLMVHDYGPGRQFASVHVEMSAGDDVIESHDVIDDIERDFLHNDNLHMIVHYDPIVTDNSETSALRALITEAVQSVDSVITIHDLRIIPGKTYSSVLFDCVVPSEFKWWTEEIRRHVNEAVTAQHPTYRCVITFDTGYAALPHEE